MDALEHLKEKIEEKVADKGEKKEKEKSDVQSTNQESSSGSLPPSSASSSPSHEFSFTISLQPPHNCKSTPSSNNFEIDLSPADDIFFHGHLLPLQILSHHSISPRSSTSFNDLNLPIFHDQSLHGNNDYMTNSNGSNMDSCSDTSEMKGRSKPKSFSLSRLAKWSKAFEISEKWEEKKKMKFGVSRVLKKYVKAVRPFLFFHGGNKDKCDGHRQPHSFSGTLNSKWKDWGGGKVGGFSAPASMRTSPTNSGLLVATASISSSNDSTMEELQNAIQAAIAHCKNSIAVKEEKCKC